MQFPTDEYLIRSSSVTIHAKIGTPDSNSIVPPYANLQLQVNEQPHFLIDAQTEKPRFESCHLGFGNW